MTTLFHTLDESNQEIKEGLVGILNQLAGNKVDLSNIINTLNSVCSSLQLN